MMKGRSFGIYSGYRRREVMRRCRAHRNRFWRNIIVSVVVLCGLCSITIFATAKLLIEPNLENVAGMRAEAVVYRTINQALAAQFAGKIKEEEEDGELFKVRKNEDGRIEMVQADSVAINILMSELSVKLQESFQNMNEEKYSVPAGALLGSKVLSQVGPDIDVRIIPMSISSMDFRTEFESQGINQTKYKIYIELECRIRVLAPFSSQMFNTSSTILVAEAVILGEVPDSYVEVPEDDILDVTD